jgi:hypothetical protein
MSNFPLESCVNWYLYNLQTRKQFGPMGTGEIKDYLGSLGPEDQKASLIWCPFWKNFRNGFETLEVLESLSSVIPRSRKPIEVVYQNSEPDFSTDYPVLRKFPRIPAQLKVTLIGQGLRFRTQTATLSLGGMAFKDSAPSRFFQTQCVAVISHENEMSGIVAGLAKAETPDPNAPVKCVRIEELRGWSMTTYMDWLKAFGNKNPHQARFRFVP